MKFHTLTCFIFLLFQKIPALGQSLCKLDKTVFDFGNIPEGSDAEASFKVTNISKYPISINRVISSGGGAYSSWSNEAIMPGKSSYVTMKYDTRQRRGPINKTNTAVISNSKTTEYIPLSITGRVVHVPTTASIDKINKDVGNIRYGETYLVTFTITNTGTKELYADFFKYSCPEVDLVGWHLDVDSAYRGKGYATYKPGAALRLTGTFINNYGNVGRFSRTLKFVYNDIDTLSFEVSGNYSAGNIASKVSTEKTQGRYTYYYRNNQLYKMTQVDLKGVYQSEYLFKNAYLVTQRVFPNGNTTQFNETTYKNGLKVGHRSVNNKK